MFLEIDRNSYGFDWIWVLNCLLSFSSVGCLVKKKWKRDRWSKNRENMLINDKKNMKKQYKTAAPHAWSHYLLTYQALVDQCFVLWSPYFCTAFFSLGTPPDDSISWTPHMLHRLKTISTLPTSKSNYHEKNRSTLTNWHCKMYNRETVAWKLTNLNV